MTHQVCVWIPQWPAYAAVIAGLAENHEPVAIVRRQEVICTNHIAMLEGTRVGMREREALAVVPHAVMFPEDCERDGREFESILRAIDALVADFVVLRPGTVLFASRGPMGSFETYEELAEALTNVIAEVAGCEARIGMAEGTLASVAASRCDALLGSQESARFLREQPIGLVRQIVGRGRVKDVDHCLSMLERLGIRTVGTVIDLGAPAMVSRFGAIGRSIWELCTGEDAMIPVHAQAESLAVHRVFEPALSNTEPIIFAAKGAADELTDRMAERAVTGGRLNIAIAFSNGQENERCWALNGGGARDITDRVRWQLSAWLSERDTQEEDEPKCAVRLDLRLEGIRSEGQALVPLWGGVTPSQTRAHKVSERLQALLGEEAVMVPRRMGGRTPAQSYKLCAYGDDPVDRSNLPWPGGLPEPHPAVVRPRPERIDVRDECGHGLLVSEDGFLQCARGCESAEIFSLNSVPVRAWAGPWPVSERWWASDGFARAYVQVQTPETVSLAFFQGGYWYEEGRYA